MRSILLACLLLLVGTVETKAQRFVITEDAIIRAVISGDHDLNVARLAAEASTYRAGQVVWPFPMLESGFMPGMISDGELGLALMLRQGIPWPGIIDSRRRALASESVAATAEYRAFERERVTEARVSYAMLWSLIERRAQIDSFAVRLDIFEEAAISAYAAGRGRQQAVLQVQIERERLRQRMQQLDDDAAAMRRHLEHLTGGQIRIAAGAPLAPPRYSRVAEVPSAPLAERVEAHPEVQARDAMIEAARHDVSIARLEGRPDLTLGADVNLSPMARQRMYGLEPVMPTVGISLPLWRSGIRARIQEAQAIESQRISARFATQVLLESDALVFQEQLERSDERIRRIETDLLPRVEIALETTFTAVRAGTATTIDLIDLERTALELRNDLIEERARRAQIAAQLRSIIGE